ncbi:hypothetical protein ABFS83_05G027700 [Erythranthe nasuta]
MDSSKINEGSSEECSSSESGWTMYIASPENQPDHGGDDDDDDDDDDVSGYEKCHRYEKDAADHQDATDSDDSMASDASSGPSGMHLCGSYERKYVGNNKNNYLQHETENTKKKTKKNDERIQMKTEKEHKSGNRANSAGKSKKT